MNNRLSLEFGQDLRADPGSKKSPDIRNADALEIEWVDVLPLDECSYVFRQSSRSSSGRKYTASPLSVAAAMPGWLVST